MHRDGDEVSSDLMSFRTCFVNLEAEGRAHVTAIELSTLSLDDVVEMISSELRLPRRLVIGLADVVHKRTHGHAVRIVLPILLTPPHPSPLHYLNMFLIHDCTTAPLQLFLVQLLNSLVSDSTIAYSPLNRRFDWAKLDIDNHKTPDSVASLIVSKLKSLSPEELKCLRIISCFGMHTDYKLLELLESFGLAPRGGFMPYLPNLAVQGVVEAAGHSTRIVFR